MRNGQVRATSFETVPVQDSQYSHLDSVRPTALAFSAPAHVAVNP